MYTIGQIKKPVTFYSSFCVTLQCKDQSCDDFITSNIFFSPQEHTCSTGNETPQLSYVWSLLTDVVCKSSLISKLDPFILSPQCTGHHPMMCYHSVNLSRTYIQSHNFIKLINKYQAVCAM